MAESTPTFPTPAPARFPTALAALTWAAQVIGDHDAGDEHDAALDGARAKLDEAIAIERARLHDFKSHGMPITWREMSIDDVDGGIPKFTLSPVGEPSRTYMLAPDAVRAIVDGLIGVAEAAPGETRIVVKMSAKDLAAAILSLKETA